MKIIHPMYKVISFGYRCLSASFLKLLSEKTESYPFDWVVSNLDTIKNCIETNFVEFLNTNNYVKKLSETANTIDDKKNHIRYEHAEVNMFYETNSKNNQTYSYKLAMTHYNLKKKEDHEYYQRCVDRLYNLLEMDIKKYYLYFHPIMGINDFQTNKDNILNDFYNFNQYIIEKTQNIFGIYFIMINHNDAEKSVKLLEMPNYVVFLINCNDDFLDGGLPFMGNHSIEKEEVLRILKKFFV